MKPEPTQGAYVTNIACPPCEFLGEFYWERSLDPWHPDAFNNVLQVSWWTKFVRRFQNIPKRKEGWMAIDYAENAIGFIPDGTECAVPKHKYVIRETYKARLCAIPDVVDLVELFDERKSKGYYKDKTK